MELTHFGGLALPRADEDVMFPYAARTALIELPYGGYDEDGQPSILKPLTITRTFKLLDEECQGLNNKLDTLMKTLASGRKVLRGVWRDGTRRQTFAKVLSVSRPRRSDDRTYQELTVDFQLDYPYWMSTDDEPHYLDHGDFLDGGWYLDGNYTVITINALSISETISNGGTMEIRRGTLVFIPAAGASLTNPQVKNVTNGMWLKYTGLVADPQRLTIELLSKSVKLDATDAYAALTFGGGQMDWLQLEPGDNEIEVTALARVGNTTLEWHWSRHFV